MTNAFTDPFNNLGYRKIANDISKFLYKQLDNKLSHYDLDNIIYNKQNCINNITHVILSDLYNYIVSLYKLYNSSYAYDHLLEVQASAELMSYKFETLIRRELNLRIIDITSSPESSFHYGKQSEYILEQYS
jgi:hypothetical protein